MKTPMQELIHEMQKSPLMFASALTLIEEMSMLEKEKEVMKSCIVAGMEFIPVDPNHYNEDAEEIYNETFNTKEK